MSVQTAVEQLAFPIGREIGASTDKVQADLLNGFAEMLESSCGNQSAIDRQLCFIHDKLNRNARRVIKQLSEFIISAEARA